MNSNSHNPQPDTSRGVARVDLFAALMSVLCIVHCLALPLLVSALALSIPFAENEAVHIALVLMAVPATLWVIHKSRGKPNYRTFIWVAASGLLILLAGTFVPPQPALEEPLVVVGALILASAHLWHWSDLRAARRTSGDMHGQIESAD